jgi:hypothetical protein
VLLAVKADDRAAEVGRALFPELSAVTRLAAIRRCTAHARCTAPIVARGLRLEPWGKCETAVREEIVARPPEVLERRPSLHRRRRVA